MPKKLKLTTRLADDYTIIGIACHLKYYRITLSLNRQLHFCFKRDDDLVIGDKEDQRAYSFFICRNYDERRIYFLVSNHHPDGRLVPSEKGVDYFLIVDDILPAEQKKNIISGIQSVKNVLSAFEIPLAKIKNPDVIFEEIELHGMKG